MDIKHIRKLLQEGSVVLVEDGQPPLLVRELKAEEPPQEVPIASRWPKPVAATTVFDGRQEQILERLNKEILALREQIAQDEGR